MGTNRRGFLQGTAAFGAAALATPLIAQNRPLTIISDIANADTRRALEDIANRFGQENGIDVIVNNMDHEAHKTAIRNYLVASPPDISFWFSGARMRTFVERDLFADITDLVEREGWADVVPALSSTTIDGRQYGMPTDGILWGLWHRQDVFDEMGFTVPATFEDYATLIEQARGADMTPMAIGTKNMWPAAGWFDHMNLRTNGLDHHMRLMRGEISYTDESLQRPMEAWAELINNGLYLENATSYSWEQAAAGLVQKRAAMMELGGFINYAFPEDQRDQLRFSLVPRINPEIGQFEDFSSNSIHVPTGAPNPEMAREFLAFFYRPVNLESYVRPEGNIPARSDLDIGDNPIIKMSMDALEQVEGTAQYFDRDTDPDVAQAGLRGFQEFMARPDRAERIMQDIERVRQRVYGDV